MFAQLNLALFCLIVAIHIGWEQWVLYQRRKTGQKVITKDPTMPLVGFGAIMSMLCPAVIAYVQPSWGFIDFSFPVRLFGTALVILSVALFHSAHYHLAENWMGTVTKLEGQKLVTTGPFSIIRHPIYTSALALVIGSLFMSGNVGTLVSIAFVTCMVAYRVQAEDKLIGDMFGEAHAAWKRRTFMLVPYVI